MFDKIYDIAASAMSANRLRINTVASNLANAQTTRTAEGGPFAALAPYFIQLGVVMAAIVGLVAYQVLRRKPQA